MDTTILSFKDTQITDIKIDSLAIQTFNGTHAKFDKFTKYPTITFLRAHLPDISLEPTSTGFYGDPGGFVDDGQLLTSIVRYAATHNIANCRFSQLLQYLLANCDSDGSIQIKMANHSQYWLPYTTDSYQHDYRIDVALAQSHCDHLFVNNKEVKRFSNHYALLHNDMLLALPVELTPVVHASEITWADFNIIIN